MSINKFNLLHFDAEWVPVEKNVADLSEPLKEAWANKCEKLRAAEPLLQAVTEQQLWETHAMKFAEFHKIICISFGAYSADKDFKVASVSGDDEKVLLEKAKEIFLNSMAKLTLCGHSIKRFDMPWIAKRMMINGINPPKSISLYGKKPWEVDIVDISELWGQGCMGESYTPLEFMSVALGIKSPKGSISGADVKNVYWAGGLDRIVSYCEGDVVAQKDVAEKIISLM